ncbi:MAG TPA: hypothetical protein VGJ63_11035 [Micromonosporaceae bacterium]|jgi:hypothetical protein
MPASEHAQIWASFSVFDHLKPGAFLPEVVMYDRLIVPVPPQGDRTEWDRWEAEGWDPTRQRELLSVLAPVAEQVEWTQLRRDVWKYNYQQARSSAGQYLRQSLAGAMTAAGLFDVVPAMALPVVATSPYTSLQELTRDLGIRREAMPVPLPASTVSAVVGRELLLPDDDSRSELDLLREAVHVVTGEADYRNARVALHDRLRRFTRDGVTDVESLKTAVRELKHASDEVERAVHKRRIWVNARRLFSFSQIVLGAVLTPLSPVAVGLVVAGIGQFTASEMLADPQRPERLVPDVAMLLDVRHELSLDA